MKLTDEQVEAIKAYVEAQKVKIPSLRDDLIDHLCCVIERELGKGQSFEDLLYQAVADIAPNGLQELEHKTLFLLNAQRLLFLKRLLYLTGFGSAVAFTGGVVFKLLQLPGINKHYKHGILAIIL